MGDQLAILTWPQRPELICSTQEEFLEAGTKCPHTNFLKGVRWSPDGACCLTASDDCWLRVFDLPRDVLERPAEEDEEPSGSGDGGEGDEERARAAALDAARRRSGAEAGSSGGGGGARRGRGDSLRSALQVHAGESIYDYAWFTGMSTLEPASCCFASTARGHPIHLWDACGGQLRASYRAHDDADEPTAAFSLAFSPDGAKVLGGYNRCFRIFDVERPGRDCKKVATQRRGKEGSLAGIVSCLAFNPPASDLLAAGAYSGGVALFDCRADEQLLLLQGHKGGVTQVLFSRDGNYLYSGARRDPKIFCWDVRATAAPLYEIFRATATTNQRVQFDIDPSNRHLATGGEGGEVSFFDLRDGKLAGSFRAAGDVISGCALHPIMGLPLLATASGQRRYGSTRGPGDESSGDEGDGPPPAPGPGCNSLRLWRLAFEWVPVADAEGGDGCGDTIATAAAAGDEDMAEAAGDEDGGGGRSPHVAAAALDAIPFVRV